MPKIGETRTRVVYGEATDMYNLARLGWYSLLGSLGVAGLILPTVGGKFAALVSEIISQAAGYKLSDYKIKFTIHELYGEHRAYDTDQWVTYNGWAPTSIQKSFVKK